MANTRILIVEDESILALGIQSKLEGFGYDVPTLVSSGEQAIKKADEIKPDLVLMDIMLEGEMDGIGAAEEIRSRFNIPVGYLTALSDERTLERAKITEPFGYILKPFDERELHTTIEMALYKHKMEKKLRENEEWLSTTLRSIGDAEGSVIQVTDLLPEIADLSTPATQADEANEDEKQLMPDILKRAGGNRSLAARMPGIGRTTLYRRLAELGIKTEN